MHHYRYERGTDGGSLLLARPLSLIFMSKEPALLPVTIRAFSIYSLSFLMVGYNIYASSFLPPSTTASSLP